MDVGLHQHIIHISLKLKISVNIQIPREILEKCPCFLLDILLFPKDLHDILLNIQSYITIPNIDNCSKHKTDIVNYAFDLPLTQNNGSAHRRIFVYDFFYFYPTNFFVLYCICVMVGSFLVP